MAYVSPHELASDYYGIDDAKRKNLIIEYVKFIEKEVGCKAVKVFAKKDPNELISFRAMFTFMHDNMAGIRRKHTAFFEARNFSDFSLKKFESDVLETEEIGKLNAFIKALKIRILQGGFTDEEILGTILSKYQQYAIRDVVTPNGELVIPAERYEGLFNDLNMFGGNDSSARTRHR